MRHLFASIIFTFLFTSAKAQDTLIIHAVHLSSNGSTYLVDNSPVSAEVFKKLQEEQNTFKAKAQNKICWIKKLDKDNRMTEQGLFCNGTTPVGNLIKYDKKGQVKYKKLYSGVRITRCEQSEVGRKAVEEIYDFSAGLRIYGSYKDGVKDGQFLYYEKLDIVGVEAYEKGTLLKRTGKIFTVKEDGTFLLTNLASIK